MSVLLGGVWVALSVWAAGRAESMFARPEVAAAAAGTVTLVTALIVALAAHAAFCRRLVPRPVLIPTILTAVVWAGLIAGRHVPLADAVGLALIVLAWIAVPNREPPVVPMAVVTGAAVAFSPLLIGSAVGLALVVCPLDRDQPWRFALAGWTVVGLTAGLLFRAVAVPLDWGALAMPVLLADLGPASVWRHLADLLDLVAPGLVVGALGALADPSPGLRNREPSASQNAARITHALVWWLICNGLLACLAPRLCAGHLLAMTAPAVLLIAPGWLALRRLVSSAAPPATLLPGAVCLFLLAVLAWTPAAATARAILVAFLPP